MSKKKKHISRKQLIIIYSLTAVLLLGLLFVGCRATSQPEINTPEDEAPADLNGSAADNDAQITDDGDDIVEDIPEEDEDFRAVWVASVMNLDFPSRRNLSAAALKREIDEIVSRSVQLGLNAIIFQVRPTGDSFYKSEIFPWSHWLSGTQGQGISDFDPLEYWIEACHENGIELHAWLNPYRIIHTVQNSSDPAILSPDNPVYKNPELAVGWSNSSGNKGLFLDPGLPEARQLIIDGITEIATNYNVDGIHIDDYFYPGTNFNDSESYGRYGNGMELDDWRRDNVNTLIKEIQKTIREINNEHEKEIRWGISPSAIWQNTNSDPLGVPVSSTFESYNLLYADTRHWVMEEWIDYICPQIYWYIGFETAGFEPILDWWVDLCRDYDVDLYIGHAAYRENEKDQPPNWDGEIIRQLEMTEGFEEITGNVFYRFHSLKGMLGNTIRTFFLGEDDTERLPVMVLDTLTVGMPENDTILTASASNAPGFNVVGTSVPGIPLYLNGEEVTNRTLEGFFFIFVPLESGENVFTFTQEGQEDVVRKITRNRPGGGGGGGGGGAATTVTQVTSPRYAAVTTDEAWLLPGNTSTGGSDWMLSKGQRDRVVSVSSNGFVKLSCGAWVNDNNVSIRSESALTENVLKNGVYKREKNHDILVWETSVFSAVYPVFDGKTLTINFGMHTEAPPLNLSGGLSQTLFSNHSSGVRDGVPYHEFTVRNDVNLEGYFVEFENNELRFYLKKRKTLAQGDKPLTGFSFVLDAGHGGEHNGAIGPMGSEFAEKHLTLINALKLAERLEDLGAAVYLTRDDDSTVSLQERVNISNNHKPDLFISLHINSVAETTNATNIRGFTVWHRNPNTEDISQTMLDVMHMINPATNRHKNINQSNLFVCRPAWTPSVLLEAGFIINIDDFVWLIDPTQQDRMADATVTAILEYYS
ncbi:MAG: family 10 glycosylhydrolase [Oscillospiraceae bacterium]|nr:family 10 glycosylhydrolase [Oscillospiraceae bacterium]